MTYCVGLMLNRGLVMMSDTRTNGGVDNVSTFRKMFTWCVEGERVITILTAGNLATTQALISTLEERTKLASERNPSILTLPTMFQIAKHVGDTLRSIIKDSANHQLEAESQFGASLLISGQIADGQPCLFMVYPEGNFIEASPETPFLQIGETKYGRPILVRAYDRDMGFDEAVKMLLLSFDSTVKANLSVAPPFDLMLYEKDSLRVYKDARIEADDPQYQALSTGWGLALKRAVDELAEVDLTKFERRDQI